MLLLNNIIKIPIVIVCAVLYWQKDRCDLKHTHYAQDMATNLEFVPSFKLHHGHVLLILSIVLVQFCPLLN